MQKILLCRKFSILLCRKFFYAENSYRQKILLCRKFFSGRKFFSAENSSMAENSSVKKTLLFSCRKFFYGRKFFCAENSFIFMQKILLCRKISLLGPKSFSFIYFQKIQTITQTTLSLIMFIGSKIFYTEECFNSRAIVFVFAFNFLVKKYGV